MKTETVRQGENGWRRAGARRLALGLCALTLSSLAAAGCATGGGAARLGTDTFEARKRLTRELVASQEWAAAFAYADDLHRAHPNDAEVLVLRGTVYRERGLAVEAEADLREAVRLNDRLAEAHAALGILFDIAQRSADAEAEHRRAVELQPNNTAYLNNLGFSLFLRGKHQDAIRFYSQATRLSPTNRRLRTNLGFALAARGDFRRAAHEFEMGGSPAEAKNNLGYAYEQKGDFTNAFDLYAQAVRLDPVSTRLRSNLVHIAEKIGRDLPGDLPAEPTKKEATP